MCLDVSANSGWNRAAASRLLFVVIILGPCGQTSVVHTLQSQIQCVSEIVTGPSFEMRDSQTLRLQADPLDRQLKGEMSHQAIWFVGRNGDLKGSTLANLLLI
jgi:hypothetical protein